jgi:superfamily II DNA or RNA helicase
MGVREARLYQVDACAKVEALWSAGTRSVCLIAPTGAGKTEMASILLTPRRRALVVAHQRDLVSQLAARLAARFGEGHVGVLMAGHPAHPEARIQVGTVQTLLARDLRPQADLLVLDECHHYVAESYRELVQAYPGVRCVGLTATPERADGSPLGDVFEESVVAAHYSDLLAEGYIVPVRLYQPERFLGADLAKDPVEAWLALANRSQAFVFCARVAIAEALAERFRLHVPAACISAETPTEEREKALRDFREGRLRVITNVDTMTEGIDVPELRCIILAKGCDHVSTYLQATGRGLRACAGKLDAIVIDLVGSSIRHGFPTCDREYSLTGTGIGMGRPTPPTPPTDQDVAREAFVQEVVGVPLIAVTDAADARRSSQLPPSPSALRASYEAMWNEGRRLGRSASAVAVQFRDRFGTWPPTEWASLPSSR